MISNGVISHTEISEIVVLEPFTAWNVQFRASISENRTLIENESDVSIGRFLA